MDFERVPEELSNRQHVRLGQQPRKNGRGRAGNAELRGESRRRRFGKKRGVKARGFQPWNGIVLLASLK